MRRAADIGYDICRRPDGGQAGWAVPPPLTALRRRWAGGKWARLAVAARSGPHSRGTTLMNFCTDTRTLPMYLRLNNLLTSGYCCSLVPHFRRALQEMWPDAALCQQPGA